MSAVHCGHGESDLGCEAWCTNQKASILDRNGYKAHQLASPQVRCDDSCHSAFKQCSNVLKKALELRKRKEGQTTREFSACNWL